MTRRQEQATDFKIFLRALKYTNTHTQQWTQGVCHRHSSSNSSSRCIASNSSSSSSHSSHRDACPPLPTANLPSLLPPPGPSSLPSSPSPSPSFASSKPRVPKPRPRKRYVDWSSPPPCVCFAHFHTSSPLPPSLTPLLLSGTTERGDSRSCRR